MQTEEAAVAGKSLSTGVRIGQGVKDELFCRKMTPKLHSYNEKNESVVSQPFKHAELSRYINVY